MNIQRSVLAAIVVLMSSIASAQTVEYIHTDALGSPVAVTNASGVVIERTVYEPYGAVINRPVTNGPGYTGHVMDAVTGLNYMQQRYYDPQLGRFLSNDPVTATSVGGNFNRYWYANNNPYRFVDPDGRESGAAFRAIYLHDSGVYPQSMSSAEMGLVADFTPGVGDIKGVVEAAMNPSIANIVGAVVGFVPVAGDIAKGAIKNSDLVVRGGSAGANGANSVEGLAKGTGTHPSGVTGFSAEAKSGATLCELCVNVKHNQVGVTTAGEIRAAGGDVIPTEGMSPNHVTITGIDPATGNKLLTPTQTNPIPPDQRTFR